MGTKSVAVMRPLSPAGAISLRPVTTRWRGRTTAAMTTRVVATDAHEGPVFVAGETPSTSPRCRTAAAAGSNRHLQTVVDSFDGRQFNSPNESLDRGRQTVRWGG